MTMPMATTIPPRPVGHVLREWRERRRLSQMALALDADVSTRHVSFLETGRSQPSREMLLRLAERLDVPLRDRNTLLLAAGFAPAYPERPLDDDALAVHRRWTLVAANRAVAPLLAGVAPTLLAPPVNVLRLSLHPDGLAPRIANLPQWRAHLLDRLRRQVDLTADPGLTTLLAELHTYPANIDRSEQGLGDAAEDVAPALRGRPSPRRPTSLAPTHAVGSQSDDTASMDTPRRDETAADRAIAAVAVPLRLRTAHGPLTFLSTTMVFGTPVDITLAELAIESFFPADPATAEALRLIASGHTTAPSDR